MAKILVLYYSMYDHIETMANAVAEGAHSMADRKPRSLHFIPPCYITA